MTDEAAPSGAQTPEPSTQPKSRHPIRGRGRGLALALAAIGWAGMLGFAGVGVWYWLLAYTQYGPAVVWRWSVAWFLAAAVLSPLAVAGLIRYWRLHRTEVRLYPQVLVYQGGRRKQVIPWEDIDQVLVSAVRYGLLGLSWGNHVSLRLHLRQGGHLEFTHALEDFDHLAETVKQHVYPRMLAEYTRAFNRGHPVVFGPVSLDRQGVQHGKHHLAWSQLGQARLERGSLELPSNAAGAAPKIRVPAHQVPNVDLCLQLIQAIQEGT